MDDDRNRLVDATSPYLLQHAQNPVHWRQWGPEAFAEAKRRDCPILLSVGYAACHWCHVMAHESFEDVETANRMNALFVNVKVDREERPDIDHVYMTALHAMGEQGGWPMTLFLDPDGRPMYGGTYWPPAPRWGRPSFRQVVEGVGAAWRDRRDDLGKERDGAGRPSRCALRAAAGRRPDARRPDPRRRGAPARTSIRPRRDRQETKFPNAPIFRFFSQQFFRRERTSGSARPSEALLEAISAGGIYDHLGGGYSRYPPTRWPRAAFREDALRQCPARGIPRPRP